MIFAYALREGRAGLRGFGVFLGCLALGVFMIAGVLSLSAGMKESLNIDARRLLGGDISVREKMDVNFGKISHIAETRGMARRVDETRAALAEIKGVDAAWPLIGTTDAPKLNGGTAAAESALLAKLGLKSGDKIKIGNKVFTATTFEHEPDRLSAPTFALSPRILISLDDFTKAGLAEKELRTDFSTRILLKDGMTIEKARAALQKEGRRIRDYTEANPRTERIVARLTLFLMIIAAGTLLIGGLGVQNAVGAFLDTRLSHIATLKSLGARTSFVAGVYLTQIFLLALCGTIIGLIGGALAAHLGARTLTALFELSAPSALQPQMLALSSLFGISTAMLFSAIPLKRALSIRPSALFRETATAALGTRTGVLLSLSVGLAVLVAVGLVEYNFTRILKDDLNTQAPSFFFVDIEPQQEAAFRALLKDARDITVVPSLRGRIVAVNGEDAQTALKDKNEDWLVRSDRAFTALSKQPPHGRIIEGKWWPEDYKGKPLISVADNVARGFGISVGDHLTINVMGVNIEAEIANVREIDWSSFAMNFAVTFDAHSLSAAPSNKLATAIVSPETEEALQAEIAKKFPNVTAVRVKDILEAVRGMIRTVALAVRACALLTLVAGALVLAGSVAAARKRHTYEAVVKKALGATRPQIMRGILKEYARLGLAAVLVALITGTAGSYAIMRFVFNLPWKFDVKTAFAITALCLALTLAAGLIGAWRALGEKAARYLRAD